MKEGWKSKPIINIYKEYFNILEQLLASNLFDILGHIDVIKVYGHKPKDDESNQLYNMYDKLLTEVKKSKITVEVNTAGLRKPVKEIYPAPELMDRLALNKIPIILNSDAHQPIHVGADYETAINYLKSYGVNKISTFNKRKITEVELG